MKELVTIAVVALLVIVGPLATIWAMNTLFPALAIPYNLTTWVAVVVLKGFAVVTVSRKK